MSYGDKLGSSGANYDGSQYVNSIRERSSITSAHWRGVGGLTENADAADALRGVSGQN